MSKKNNIYYLFFFDFGKPLIPSRYLIAGDQTKKERCTVVDSLVFVFFFFFLY